MLSLAIEYKYAYLLGNLFLCFPIWLLLLLKRRDLWKQILLISFIGGLAGPVSEFWYLHDYWRPQIFTGWSIGLEDFLFGFFIAGIASVCYEAIFGKRLAKRRHQSKQWPYIFIALVALFLFCFNILFFLGINSIYASSIGFLVLSLLIVFKRRDLWSDALMSGVIMGGLMFLGYLVFLWFFPEAIERWWYLKNISGVLFLGIPLEEILWASSWGMVAGPCYEYLMGLKFKKEKN